MNLGTGALLLIGFLSLTMGIVLEFKGISLLSPYIESTNGYVMLAVASMLVALVIHQFEEK